MKTSLQGWMTACCLLMSSVALAQAPNVLLPAPSDEPPLVPQPKEMRESAPTSSNTEGSPTDASFEAELQQLRQEIAAARLLRESLEKTNLGEFNNNLTTAEQRRHLTELLSKLAVRGLAKRTPPAPASASPTPETTATPPSISKANSKSAAQSHPLITDKIVDPF